MLNYTFVKYFTYSTVLIMCILIIYLIEICIKLKKCGYRVDRRDIKLIRKYIMFSIPAMSMYIYFQLMNIVQHLNRYNDDLFVWIITINLPFYIIIYIINSFYNKNIRPFV